ncbi:hypothetical protein L7F22_025871 [Adiantum nelumboides]|nr:hypothetical protein [Adiantum nelumboides]
MMQAIINAKRIKASSIWVTPDGDEKAPLDSYITLIEEYGKLKRADELNVGDEAINVIDRYAKSGCLSKAQEVVDKLPVRSALTWTALIGGYAEHSCDKEELKFMGSMKDNNVFELDRKAIKCFKQMKWEAEVSIAVAVMFCLKHAAVALASGYAKCGFTVEAQGVFDELDTPKVIFGTTLLVSHPLHGHACSMTRPIGKWKVHEGELHGLLKQDPILGITWVDVWAKSGSFARANDKIGAKGRGLPAQSQYQDKEFPANFEDQESSQELIHQAHWKMTEMDWEGDIGSKAMRVKERRPDKAKKSSSGLFRQYGELMNMFIKIKIELNRRHSRLSQCNIRLRRDARVLSVHWVEDSHSTRNMELGYQLVWMPDDQSVNKWLQEAVAQPNYTDLKLLNGYDLSNGRIAKVLKGGLRQYLSGISENPKEDAKKQPRRGQEGQGQEGQRKAKKWSGKGQEGQDKEEAMKRPGKNY